MDSQADLLERLKQGCDVLTCAFCGRYFLPKNQRRKTCSTSCLVELTRHRSRLAYLKRRQKKIADGTFSFTRSNAQKLRRLRDNGEIGPDPGFSNDGAGVRHLRGL